MYDNSTGSCISVVGVGCIYIQGEEKGRRREEGGGRRDPPEVWRNVYLVRHVTEDPVRVTNSSTYSSMADSKPAGQGDTSKPCTQINLLLTL